LGQPLLPLLGLDLDSERPARRHNPKQIGRPFRGGLNDTNSTIQRSELAHVYAEHHDVLPLAQSEADLLLDCRF
jgi:hypothetical protein